MKIDYVVESNSETIMLVYLLLRDKVTWEQEVKQGVGTILGKDKHFPNMVGLSYIKIEGKVVCFYEATSLLVDWNEVDTFIKKEFPDSKKLSSTQLVMKFKDF